MTSDKIPETMQAVVLVGHGGFDKLVFHDDWKTPAPNDDQVLIKVGACGLNNTDVNTRSGWYSKAVSEATTGDAYAEVNEDDPTSCSYTTAEGMLSRANTTDADTVLVTGASGGVGSAVVQLAKRRGARVIAMASESKHAMLQELGADAVIPRSPDSLPDALRQATGEENVSVVADIVGGPNFGALIECLRRGGRYTCSGAIAGPIVNFDLRTCYLNDLTFTGSTVVPPHIFRDLIGFIERGEVKPLLAKTWPLAELHLAQQAFIDKQHVGNIAVTMS